MSDRNDGGPAWPTGLYADEDRSGMSLRDWFAGQALAGLLTQTHLVQKYQSDWFAKGAYQMADAMLAARNSAPTKGA